MKSSYSWTADTGVLVSEVQRIVEITFGVRADVEDNRQRAAGINTGAGGVKGELADRNAHAVDAEVAEAENTLAVSHDDHGRPLPAEDSRGSRSRGPCLR